MILMLTIIITIRKIVMVTIIKITIEKYIQQD